MKRLVAVIAGLAAAAALLAPTSAMASPAPPSCPAAIFSALAAAAPLASSAFENPCLACFTSPKTPTTYTTGSSCSVAQSNLTSLLRSIANDQCGGLACNFVVHYTVACRQISPGVWRVDGYATHGCKEYIC